MGIFEYKSPNTSSVEAFRRIITRVFMCVYSTQHHLLQECFLFSSFSHAGAGIRRNRPYSPIPHIWSSALTSVTIIGFDPL